MKVKFYTQDQNGKQESEIFGEVVDRVLSPMVIDHKNVDGTMVQYCVSATKYVILDDGGKQHLRFPVECIIQRLEKI